METVIRVKSPGNRNPEIEFGIGVHSCGKVRDGISIVVNPGGNHRFDPYSCPFVIAYADLERVYLAAKSFRKTVEWQHEQIASGQ